MHVLAALAAVAVVAAKADISTPDRSLDRSPLGFGTPDVEVIDLRKEYTVKLECVGCPYARKVSDSKAEWEQPPRRNALVLHFAVDTLYHDVPTLLLNGRAIQPFGDIPPFIQALQIPANTTAEEMDGLHNVASPYGIQLPLQYELTVLRTQEHGPLSVQFKITGLPLDAMTYPRFYPDFIGEPYNMENERQKLVQLRLHHSEETGELSIEDVSVILEAGRDLPYRKKCGRLDMVKTKYDPREWDMYGKYWSWQRLYNVTVAGGLLPWVILIVCCMFLVNYLYPGWRRRESRTIKDDAEAALLLCDDNARPAYADIPIIKIEEFD